MEWIDIPALETERLRLRAFRKSDIDDYAALNADPEVMRCFGGELWERERSFRHMTFLVGHWRLLGTGMWAVELRETGEFLGMIGFAEPEGWPGFELAWTLARRFWGHGYATEGARAALEHAFTVWKRDRVISLIREENRASIRVAERLGESLQGRTDLKGEEMLRYGIDREAWLCGFASSIGGVSSMHYCAAGRPSTGGRESVTLHEKGAWIARDPHPSGSSAG